jgi:hypothetical protein
MKRIANTLPLLALTALLMPACSFSFKAGSGSTNPNPTAKPNGGDAKGPANAPKKVSKSDGGDDSGEGRANEADAASASNDADAGSDDTAAGSGEAPPKAAGKTGVKETGVAGSANRGGQNPGSTLTSKPDAPSGPGDRVKSPN